MHAQEKTCLYSTPPGLRPSIQAHLDWLQTEPAPLDQALEDHPRNHQTRSGRAEQLPSVPGVGPVTVAVLVANLPEPGRLKSRALAALVGVAHLNRDSGQLRGSRRMRGGRASVLRIPCMATVTAIRHNLAIRAFHARLCDQGNRGRWPSWLPCAGCSRSST